MIKHNFRLGDIIRINITPELRKYHSFNPVFIDDNKKIGKIVEIRGNSSIRIVPVYPDKFSNRSQSWTIYTPEVLYKLSESGYINLL